MSYNYPDYHHRQFDHNHAQLQPYLEYPYRTGLPHSLHNFQPPNEYNAGSQPPPNPPDWQQIYNSHAQRYQADINYHHQRPPWETEGQFPFHEYSAPAHPPSSCDPAFQTTDLSGLQWYPNVGYTDRQYGHQPPYQIQPQQMQSGLQTVDYYQSPPLYRQPPDPPDWQGHSTTNGVGYTEPLAMPHDPVMPDLEPNLSMEALVSQIERLTADVEQLVSRMDANERGPGNPHAAIQPPPAPPFSIPYTAPVSCRLPQPTATAPAVVHHDPSSSSQLAAPAVPPPPPPQPTSPTSHCSSAAPMLAAAAAPSFNLPPRAPPCSPDIRGDEGELLDDDPLPPAVISQPGDPNTSPTLVPSSMKMEISEECGNNEKFYNHSHDRGWNRECIMYLHKGGKLIKVELDKSHPIELKAREFEVFIVSRVKKLAKDVIFAPKQRPCMFDPGGDTSKLLLSLTLFVASWFPP